MTCTLRWCRLSACAAAFCPAPLGASRALILEPRSLSSLSAQRALLTPGPSVTIFSSVTSQPSNSNGNCRSVNLSRHGAPITHSYDPRRRANSTGKTNRSCNGHRCPPSRRRRRRRRSRPSGAQPSAPRHERRWPRECQKWPHKPKKCHARVANGVHYGGPVATPRQGPPWTCALLLEPRRGSCGLGQGLSEGRDGRHMRPILGP